MTSPAPAASPPLSASPHQEGANEPASSVKRSSSISSLLNGSPGSSTSVKRPFSSVEGLSINTFHPLYTHTHLPTPISPAAPQSAETSRTPGGVYSSFSLRPLVAEPRGKTTDIVPKPFECSDCGQKFSRAHNLKSHKATHSAYRPFTCDTCSSSFRRMHDLKRHQKLHTGEKPFACSDCHRTFSRLDALNRHRRTENGTACNYRRSSREDGNTVNNITTTHNTTPIMNNFSNNTPSMSLSATAINNTTITATTTTTTTTAPLPQSVIPSAPVSTSIPSPPPAPPDSPHRIVLPLPQQHYPITLSYPPTQSNEPGGQSEMESLRTSFHQLSEQYKRLLDTYIQESSESSKKIHELEVENRVLRSLICEKQGETVKSNILNHTATTADM